MVLYPIVGTLDTDVAVAAREGTFVLGIRDHLPTGALGLMLVGLFAALASTVDTHLNWGASYWTNDIYDRWWCQRRKGLKADPKRLVWVARLSNIFILIVALAVMTQLGSIGAAWKMSLLLGAGMGVPLLLRWVWHRQTAWGELAPIATSFIVAPALLAWLPGDNNDANRLLIMTIFATAASVCATLLSKPIDPDHLDRFYKQVRPPGFWGPVARRCDDNPNQSRRAFSSAILATTAASLSVFALIVGLGSLVIGAPGPSWGIPRWIWISGCLVVGISLVPVWIRFATRATPSVSNS
jgi:hypothetical protein